MSTLQLEQDTLKATLTIDEAGAKVWDVIVIGAGVAGTAFAIHASRLGAKVLLVESHQFPREKVCGGCLNTRAQDQLQDLQVLDQIMASGAVELARMKTYAQARSSDWSVPRMLSVRRSTLDSILVREAIRSGVAYLDNTRGVLNESIHFEWKSVALKCSKSVDRKLCIATGKHVVVAAGLSRSPIAQDDSWLAHIEPNARLGVHCLLHRSCLEKPQSASVAAADWQSPVLHMIIGKSGYVGICPTDGEYLDIAAAIQPQSIRDHGSIGACIRSILNENRLEFDVDLEGDTIKWQATPFLTRKSEVVAQQGVFLLGDSAGYVEPFTGEGMSWALEGAKHLASLMMSHASSIQADDSNRTDQLTNSWTTWVQSHRHTKQAISRWVAKQARHPRRARMILTFLDCLPPIRNYLVKKAMQ